MFDCGELAVPKEIMQHVIQVESAKNPYAIGVVGGYLARQPANLDEALTAVDLLRREGYNFSVGLAQVNRYNLLKYGIKNYTEAFDGCKNIIAGSKILRECYERAKDWGKAFSCYYSGNFQTGFDHGYVKKIFASMMKSQTDAEKRRNQEIKIIASTTNRIRAKEDGLPFVDISTKQFTVGTEQIARKEDFGGDLKISGLLKDFFGGSRNKSIYEQVDETQHNKKISVQAFDQNRQANTSNVRKTEDYLSLDQIPLQLVGSDGDPYKVRLIDGVAVKKETNKSSFENNKQEQAENIPRTTKLGAGTDEASNSSRGGSLLNTIEKNNENEVSNPSGFQSTEKVKPVSGNDKSFVF